MDRVEVYCAENLNEHLPLLCCNVRGRAADDVAAVLDGDFDIAVRAGLHCAPLVHEHLGTGAKGAIRFSLGVYSKKEDIERAIEAMTCIAQSIPVAGTKC